MSILKKITFVFICGIIFLFCSCSVPKITPRTKIIFKADLTEFYQGSTYDALDLLANVNKNLEYNFEIYYTDYEEERTYLKLKGTKFTPSESGFHYINVTAQENGVELKASKAIYVMYSYSPEPPPIDYGNLIESGLFYSISPDNFGINSHLSLINGGYNGETALKTVIAQSTDYTNGYSGGDVFNAVWSWICFPLDSYDTSSIDISHKLLTFLIKHENSQMYNSFILVDENDVYSKEYPIEIGAGIVNEVCYSEYLSDGWYHITLNFANVTSQTFEQRDYMGEWFDITRTNRILITTSNARQDTSRVAITYFQDMYLI